MNQFEEAFREAGYDTERDRLAALAYKRLGEHGRMPDRALDAFLRDIAGDAGALRWLARAFLRDRAKDMDGITRGGASQQAIEGHAGFVRPSPAPSNDGRACVGGPESLGLGDRPAVADETRESQRYVESQSTSDLPVPSADTGGASHEADESPGAVDRPAPPALRKRPPHTKLSRGAAEMTATSDIFRRRIGFDIQLGSASYDDLVNLGKKGAAMKLFSERMLSELPWSPAPELRAKQTVSRIADRQSVQWIYDSVYKTLDEKGITNAKR